MAILKRFGPLILLLVVAIVAWASGLLDNLSPEGFAAREAQISGLAAQHPLQALAIFVLTYALLTAACLPVAMLLSLLGGYLFGTAPAAIALVIAATASSLITYGAARSAMGPWLSRRMRASKKLSAIVENIRREAFFYVLSLRFVPVAPFGAINAAAGVAKAPLLPFISATVLGILPACVIYATLGAGLKSSLGVGHFDLRAAAMKPELFLPLAGLGLLALAAGWLRSRQRASTA